MCSAIANLTIGYASLDTNGSKSHSENILRPFAQGQDGPTGPGAYPGYISFLSSKERRQGRMDTDQSIQYSQRP
jgi:hypothetical protein